jgi:DNA-binding MarR family transcriptional regulator
MSETSAPKTTESACQYIIGEDGLARWSDTEADAWIGLIETQKALTRALDAELEAKHGLRLSAAEALGRLAAAPDGRLGLSKLAGECALSLSRISRIIDVLEQRGLVERRTSCTDARAIDAHLTAAGLSYTLQTQATHVAFVQEHFFNRLDPEEIATLAEVFARFAPRAAEACTAAAEEDARPLLR